ncbi:hypothetical protein CYMTET_10499 [Cymbomonas tetramitiformis]|uniref:Thioredoxin domain-containing protein n=1 Tax=Cymbomonas tetramitiformis TaxID=36881 RepID=A0AAE0GP46_9CHLO|nr:hypothetical protein CYMTET_10499 [Cymbomonas tetramitiformis]
MPLRVLRQRPEFNPAHSFGKKVYAEKRKAITAKATRETEGQSWLSRLWQSPDKVDAFGIKKGEVKQISSAKEFDEIIEAHSERLVILDCSMTWCGPCKVLLPKFKLYAENYNDAIFLHMNGDENDSCSELFSRLQVGKVPSIHMFRDKELVSRHEGIDGKMLRTVILSQLKEGEAR